MYYLCDVIKNINIMAQKILNISQNQGSFPAQKAVNIAFTKLMGLVDKCTYPLDEIEAIEDFLQDMIEYIRAEIFCTAKQACDLLFDAGFTDDFAKTAEKIKSGISAMPKKIKVVFESTDSLMTQSKSKTKRILNDCIQQGILVHEIDPTMDLNYYTDETKYKVYAVRTKYGTQEVKFYVIENPINSDLDSRAAKATYTLDTDENYFQTRPILYENWLKLDSYHQMQTV